jgi:hypothetical protein
MFHKLLVCHGQERVEILFYLEVIIDSVKLEFLALKVGVFEFQEELIAKLLHSVEQLGSDPLYRRRLVSGPVRHVSFQLIHFILINCPDGIYVLS